MSKKLQVNDILAASDIDYIDTLENENAKLREKLAECCSSAHDAETRIDHLSATYFQGLVDAGVSSIDAKYKMHEYTKQLHKELEK